MSKKIIFISGRFRSGTSLLWNIFNSLDNYKSWYEPLHPNLISHIKYVKPKADHIGVDDYWSNYLGLEDLENMHSQSFGQNRLLMEKDESWPELKKYIDFLIKNSKDKIPVLQFNRMDLRLSWLRNQYPNSTIIHAHREPVSLWFSNRKHLKAAEWHDESHPDAYDLMQWSVDLATHFPVLIKEAERSSYFRHYFIWKLSRKIGQAEADIQLNLIDDFHKSDKGIQLLKQKLSWDEKEFEVAKECIFQPKSLDMPKDTRDLMASIEGDVDQLFKDLGLEKGFPSSKLKSLKTEKQAEWSAYTFIQNDVTNELLSAINHQKDEISELLDQARD